MESRTTDSLPHGYRLKGEKNEYVIDRVLGQGAFGITYLARYKASIQGSMGAGSVWAQVAVKEFFMRDMNVREGETGYLSEVSQDSLVGRYRRAFMREARNLASLHHPNIVNVFEVIEANNTVYIVMEYINGGSLDEHIQSKGSLSEDESINSILKVCSAVDLMHSKKILHLDIKPKNIMLDEEGNLFLIDFGLSKQFTADGEPESSTSIGLGTPGYAPVEQAEHQDSDKQFRATLDIYALGATLFKMLTGNTPPKASQVSDSVIDGNNIISEQLNNAGISEGLIEVVTKAMWPSSRGRYQSVKVLVQAINHFKNYTQSQQVVEENDSTQIIEDNVDSISMLTVKDDETIINTNDNLQHSSDTQVQREEYNKRIIHTGSKKEPSVTILPDSALKQINEEQMQRIWKRIIIILLIISPIFALFKCMKSEYSITSYDEAASHYALGMKYYNGDSGLSQNYTEALKLFRKAANQGNSDAQCQLGLMYIKGEGVTQNYAEALKWFQKAADRGNVRSQYDIGLMNYLGEGVTQNYAEALKWFQKAAEQKYDAAQLIIGKMYYFGEGVTQNYAEAAKWLKLASEQNNDVAQAFLSSLYYYGNGVTQDPVEGLKWLRLAAENGNAEAQYEMGLIYVTGEEVKSDLDEAIKWFRKSADQGHEDAKKMLEDIQKTNSTTTSVSTHSTATSTKIRGIGLENGHEWVDLGLSVKWATCNIGASSPEDYGDYYAWGEVSTKSKYTLENYRFLTIVENNGRTKVSRYNSQSGRGTVDGKTILELSDDVARQKWGGDWRMPTNAEIQELIDKCNWSWTSKGGVNGYKVTSKINGYRNNSIFLPAAGNRLEDSLYDLGEEGYYWSSSISSIVSSDARYLNFSYSNRSSSNSSREFGQSVRPVCQ